MIPSFDLSGYVTDFEGDYIFNEEDIRDKYLTYPSGAKIWKFQGVERSYSASCSAQKGHP